MCSGTDCLFGLDACREEARCLLFVVAEYVLADLVNVLYSLYAI